MSAEEHAFETPRTARYFTMKGNELPEAIWLVLHGYGQNAEFFIRHFESAKESRLILAPEGLSRFYLEGTGGRVGASWMTKVDRLNEIKDQHVFLNALTEKYRKQYPEAALNVLGFSQGTATAIRWLLQSREDIQRIVLWAGDIPPDIDHGALAELSSLNPIDLVAGTEDEWITDERLHDIQQGLLESEIRFRLHRFDGGHTIDPELLRKLI